MSEELVGLVFFDSDVSVHTKLLMVIAMQCNLPVSPGLKLITFAVFKASKHNVKNFVTPCTHEFFEKLHISADFVNAVPTLGRTEIRTRMTHQLSAIS